MVLADPDLVEAELVPPLDQLEIAVQRQRRALLAAVVGRQEDPEAQALARVPLHSNDYGDIAATGTETAAAATIARAIARNSGSVAT
jgi:hypothetical protein